MNIGPLPRPYLHPHSSAPIDIERLESVNLDKSLPRRRGRTTAFVVHMVGCALVAKEHQQWLYVANTLDDTMYARDMFLNILRYESHNKVLRSSNKLVDIDTGGGILCAARFAFIPLAEVDDYCRGRILQDYFLDCCCDTLDNFNRNNPGVLAFLPDRIQLSYDSHH